MKAKKSGTSRKEIPKKAKKILTNARWAIALSWKSCPGLLVGLVACRVVQSAVPAAVAWIGRNLINAIVAGAKSGNTSLDPIYPLLISALGITLLSEVATLIGQFLNQRFNEVISLKIDLDRLNHAKSLDISFFEDPNFHDLSQRALSNPSSHFIGFINKIFNLFTNLMKAGGIVLILIVIDPIIVGILVPLVVPYMVFRWKQSKLRYTKEYNRATKRRWSNYFSSILTNRDNVAEVRILKLGPTLIEKYRKLAIRFLKEDREIYRKNFIGTFIFAAIFGVIFYGLFTKIAYQVLQGTLSVGDVAIFAGATKQLNDMLGNIASQISGTIAETLYIDNLSELFSIKPQTFDSKILPPSHCEGEIIVKDLSFTYPGSEKEILNNISLHIKAGETVALVGENGTGKTTLAKLIARLYYPNQGDIFIDGHNIKHLDQDFLYDNLSYVFQRPNRYEATVRDNIAYGAIERKMDQAQLESICKASEIEEMIQLMPKGYDTMLGRRFGKYDLSAGQWQKLSIGRALAKESSSILILDEPTTNLDAQAEYDLFLKFKEMASKRTTLLISHHFNTISLADRIVVLKNGVIEEAGTHDELIEKNGQYAKLYELSKRR